MSAAPAIDAELDPAAVRAARLERQLARLEALAEIGMQAARAIGRQAEAEPPSASLADIALAYSRVSRAVRMAVLLQAHLAAGDGAAPAAEADDDGEPDVVRFRWMEPEHERREREVGRRERIEETVQAIAREAGQGAEAVERLRVEALERLERDDIYRELAARPFSEVLADICRDLGLAPDWPRLAETAWARAEMEGERYTVGKPLAPFVPPPPPIDWKLRRCGRPTRPPPERRGFDPPPASSPDAGPDLAPSSLWPDTA